MKTIPLLFILTFFYSCANETIKEQGKTAPKQDTAIELGVGLVSIKFDENTVLNLYETPNDKEPSTTIEFFNDTTINSLNIRNLEKQREWLIPGRMNLDYDCFVFRCLASKDGWFQVIVNNTSGKAFWLKKNELTQFASWEKYLIDMFGVARLQDRMQKIRKSASDSAEEIRYEGGDCFQVRSMKGDWIEIYTASYCDDSYTDSKTKIKSAWIKWREGNSLVIEYFSTS